LQTTRLKTVEGDAFIVMALLDSMRLLLNFQYYPLDVPAIKARPYPAPKKRRNKKQGGPSDNTNKQNNMHGKL
jgi:hypothetical protein